jgi:hypothetical protein
MGRALVSAIPLRDGFISIAAAFIAMSSHLASAQTLAAEGPVRLQVDDKVTKFVHFYRASAGIIEKFLSRRVVAESQGDLVRVRVA